MCPRCVVGRRMVPAVTCAGAWLGSAMVGRTAHHNRATRHASYRAESMLKNSTVRVLEKMKFTFFMDFSAARAATTAVALSGRKTVLRPCRTTGSRGGGGLPRPPLPRTWPTCRWAQSSCLNIEESVFLARLCGVRAYVPSLGTCCCGISGQVQEQ